MEGLTSSELVMIQKLAGNDGLVRKKTMKKLKIWLSAIARKIPDTPECREAVENNFIRVWKALFYCMWMADKPLPQEQLAEQISNLVEVFASKPNVLNLFVEWFFRSMAREWPHIDRFRLDKFMMLTRRFLRKTLMVISERKWKLDVLEGFMKILTSNIFNRRPEAKATRAKARDPAIEVAPLGMQLHVIDIFLEELAKTGGAELKSQKIIKVLTPFMNELAVSDDDRLLGDIEEKIFNHLMRQSDPGIDYAEGVQPGDEEDTPVEPEQVPTEEPDSDDELNNVEPVDLDPRAGKVDVVLPQLSISYGDLAKKLLEVGGQKTVKPRNRKLLYTLARKFKEIEAGSYPLAVDLTVPEGPAITRKDIESAAQRLVQLDESVTDHMRKKRPPKKVRRKLAKKLQEQAESSLNDSSTSEAPNSVYLEDEELLDHADDNYMSYLEELHQNGNGSTDGIEHNSSDEGEGNSGDNITEVDSADKSFSPFNLENDEYESSGSPKRKKYKTVIEVEADEIEASATSTPTQAKKRRSTRPSSPDKSNNTDVTPISTNKSPRPMKRTSIMKEKVPDDYLDSDGNSGNDSEEDTVINISGFRKRKLNDTISRGMKGSGTPSSMMSPATPGTMSAKRKRVSFVLARNLHHEHADYKQSIIKSPACPHDSEKKPRNGLLKLKSPAPGSPALALKELASTPRRRTNRF